MPVLLLMEACSMGMARGASFAEVRRKVARMPCTQINSAGVIRKMIFIMTSDFALLGPFSRAANGRPQIIKTKLCSHSLLAAHLASLPERMLGVMAQVCRVIQELSVAGETACPH